MVNIYLDTDNFKTQAKNQESIDLDFSFDDFSPNPNLLNDIILEFVCTQLQDAISKIDTHIQQKSIIHDLNCRIEIDDINVNGLLKLSSEKSEYIRSQGQHTQYNLLFAHETDTFFKKADALDLGTFLTPNDYKTVRYVTERGSVLEIIVLGLAIAQLSSYTKQIAYNTADFFKELISSGFDSLSAAIKSVLKFAMNLVFIGAMIKVFIELFKDLRDNLFIPPKKLNCINVFDTIKKGANYLGFEFESSLTKEYSGLTLLASTTEEGTLTGNPKNAPYNQSQNLLEFIERFAQLFNAKMRVFGNKIQFETISFFENRNNIPDVQLQKMYNEGTQTFNFQSLPQKIGVYYLQNVTDKNYKENYYFEVYKPSFSEKANYGVENEINVQLPFQLAKRKDNETALEKKFNGIFDIYSFINKDYKVNFGSRLGYLVLENEQVTADTLFVLDNEKVSTKSFDLLKSETLFKRFYATESPLQKQYVNVTNAGKQPICGFNTLKLLENNVIKDSEGRNIIVTKNIKNVRTGLYEIEYKRKLVAGDFGYVPDAFIQSKFESKNN